jgi:hypothetical protein
MLFLSVIICELECSLLGGRINLFYSKQDFISGRQEEIQEDNDRKIVPYLGIEQ